MWSMILIACYFVMRAVLKIGFPDGPMADGSKRRFDACSVIDCKSIFESPYPWREIVISN
jgi:hypothetical protein